MVDIGTSSHGVDLVTTLLRSVFAASAALSPALPLLTRR